jgi:acyl-CoA reductase-like NAD-dependent aldehyde dehydrogenase
VPIKHWQFFDNQRGYYLSKFAQLLAEANYELAVLDCVAMGRPISRYNDGFAAAEQFKHFAEAGYKASGKTSLSLRSNGFVNFTLEQPIGVVAHILPWYVPVLLILHKVAPSLAAGCTIVLKSSEKTPLLVSVRNY